MRWKVRNDSKDPFRAKLRTTLPPARGVCTAVSSYSLVPSGRAAASGATHVSSAATTGSLPSSTTSTGTTPQWSSCVPGRSEPISTRTRPVDISLLTCTRTVETVRTCRAQ